MRIPRDPPIGSLIAYEYLWYSQHGTRDDGAKAYPTALVVAKADAGPQPLVYALGVSHREPAAGERALEMPTKLKRHLGLDSRRSWVYTDQVNVFVWPGPDLRPASWLSTRPEQAEGCVIGPLPVDWFETVKRHLIESHRLRALRTVARP